MLFLIIAILALLVSTQMRSRKYVSLSLLVVGVFYVSLIALILSAGGLRVFAGGEAGLLGWFVGGLVFSLLGFLLPNKPPVAILVAVVCYALGFDVLQPDAYSYVPAAILAAMILVVAVTAFLRLAPTRKRTRLTRPRNPKSKLENRKSKLVFNSRTLQLALYVLAIAILVYSATFKVIDRGWLLPWSYMAAAGGLLAFASGVRVGVAPLRGKTQLRKTGKEAPDWVWVAAGRLGELLMVVSAFFVYCEFL